MFKVYLVLIKDIIELITIRIKQVNVDIAELCRGF